MPFAQEQVTASRIVIQYHVPDVNTIRIECMKWFRKPSHMQVVPKGVYYSLPIAASRYREVQGWSILRGQHPSATSTLHGPEAKCRTNDRSFESTPTVVRFGGIDICHYYSVWMF
jgi:hypothetical protein